MNRNIYISKEIQKAVYTHVFKVYESEIACPLILGIFGPSGEGKTFQCRKYLESEGYGIVDMTADMFEDAEAGNPIKNIEKQYLAAISTYQRTRQRQVIIIDDIDTLIGNWGPLYQYTINTQLIIQFLMNLTESTAREEYIPIIFTGNDFTKIYSPLTRHGRMAYCIWNPTLHEKSLIVSTIFPFSETECEQIVSQLNKYASKNNMSCPSVAFYKQLYLSLLDEKIWENKMNGENNTKLVFYPSFNEVLDAAKLLLNKERDISKNYVQ